jgi:hypothetical protein
MLLELCAEALVEAVATAPAAPASAVIPAPLMNDLRLNPLFESGFLGIAVFSHY